MTGQANKTVATAADVSAFIDAVEPETRRNDARTLLALYSRVTGEPAILWGPTIIGFGSYNYVYESGRSGTSIRSGYSPRKANLVVYLMGGYLGADMASLLARLGKHKIGKSCLYINKLADVDLAVLEDMIRVDKDYMDEKYPV